MKNILFGILAAAVLLVSCDPEEPEDNKNPIVFNTTEIANGSFENWEMKTQNEAQFESPSGNYWASLNNLSFIQAPLVLTKTEEGYLGTNAVHLEARAWTEEWTLPGILVAGDFDSGKPIGENLVHGKPITVSPSSLSFYYRYLPADNDTAVVYTSLTRWNAETQSRDTVAEASTTITGTTEVFTLMVLPYDYRSEARDQDTINIIFLTSISGQNMKAHAGSIMEIDDVKLIMPRR